MRPQILFPLFAEVTSLKGVGAKVAPLVQKVAGPLVRDLAFLPPTGVIVRRAMTAVDAVEVRASNPGPTVQGTTAVYAAAAPDGSTLVVTLIATECSDGMSDRVYPLTARVELGTQTLNGCAASVAFLNSQPAP